MKIIRSKLDILKALFSVLFLIMFCTFARLQYDSYMDEPTRINFNEHSMQDIPFPAVTICDKNYKHRQAHYDLGFPRSLFGKEPKLTYTTPYCLFRKLTLVDEYVVSNMWIYYFTLDEIFSVGENICQVGTFTCHPNPTKDDYFKAYPDDRSQQEAEFEVEAGMWRSRILADSKRGDIFMCHTLIPNVSVSFSTNNGNSLSFNWDVDYMNTSYLRQVYIHDKHEHVLLDTFAINSEASFDVETLYSNSTERTTLLFETAKRFQLIPTQHLRPDSSQVHPCTTEAMYSESWCKINHNWNRKIQVMKDHFGDNFTCISPGIWDNVGQKWPVCQHFEKDDVPSKTLGLNEVLFSNPESHNDPTVPTFKAPPLGVYDDLNTKECIPRCSKYSYALKEEKVTEYGAKDNHHVVYLYFASPVVQVLTEFRLINTVDFFASVGGTMGLVLGMSLLSLTFIALDMTKKILKKIL